MKKLLVIGAFLLGIFSIHNAYSSCCGGYGFGGNAGFGGAGCGCGCDTPTGECICKYVTYQPCYYQTRRCIEEQIPCTRRCCRMVPQYYQVQRCCMVPQYYCETKCRYCPEYYCVQDFKTCRRVICEPQCTYIPRCYWKRTCCNPGSCCP